MALPKIALPSSSIELGGERVEFHSLSRSQALKLNGYQGREDEAEDFMLASALDVSLEEAHEWRDSTDLETVGQLIDAVIELSGLTGPKAEAAPKEPLKAVK